MKKNDRVAPTPLTESGAELENDLSEVDDYSIIVSFNRIIAKLDSAIAELQALKKNILNE